VLIEQLIDEIEEERVHLKRAIRVLEQDVAALKRQVEGESEGHLEG
jgi:cell division septum initiation protein DivIVA